MRQLISVNYDRRVENGANVTAFANLLFARCSFWGQNRKTRTAVRGHPFFVGGVRWTFRGHGDRRPKKTVGSRTIPRDIPRFHGSLACR